MWTNEQRKAASERAKARWANSDYRSSQGKAIAKPPCCPQCGEANIAKFYVDKNGRRTNKTCKECHKKNCNIRWHSKSSIDRWTSKSYKYGVTKEYLLELYEKQQGKCAICGEIPQTERGLHVDHCHSTKVVRGLLCHGCNTGIGALKEDAKILSKAIDYLRNKNE